MDVDPAAVTRAYLEHLTTGDRALLVAADPDGGAPADGDDAGGWLAAPGRLDRLLSSPRVFDAVFLPGPSDEPLLAASPFLVFAVAVQRAAGYLEEATYVSEWLGPGQRAPIFDVAPLRDFVAHPGRRLFLAELLASYTRVSSGSFFVPTRRGRRRQRFSELDPVRLAGLLEVVPEAERVGVLRRMGDLALFLTGVFPDHVARQGFGSVEEGRLLRAGRLARRDGEGGGLSDGSLAGGGLAGRGRGGGRVSSGGSAGGWEGLGDGGAVGLLERLGRTWYGAAAQRAVPPISLAMLVVGELPERFGQARRILNLITDRFLFVQRERWFGQA